MRICKGDSRFNTNRKKFTGLYFPTLSAASHTPTASLRRKSIRISMHFISTEVTHKSQHQHGLLSLSFLLSFLPPFLLFFIYLSRSLQFTLFFLLLLLLLALSIPTLCLTHRSIPNHVCSTDCPTVHLFFPLCSSPGAKRKQLSFPKL